ncbi:MAG: hypothetical protein EHM56_08675, partial [Chloroflexi bacterium]
MLAVIRARFPNTPASAVWSDAAMQAWLDPTIPFSLAHYWTRTSFLGADMRYVLFPPVVLNDPRPNTPPGGDVRDGLVRAVLDQVTAMSDPDWVLFDQFLICFAQPTDMFGGGAYTLKTRPGSDRTWITGAVVDVGSAFDGICQEVGHGFGFDHELNAAGADYGSPYSVMSSAGQGSSFERPVDGRLPAGVMPPGRADQFGPATTDPQRVVGPYIPTVQFYVTGFGPLKHPDSIVQVPATYAQTPFTFRIEALDAAVAAWPQRRRVLAVLPPLVPNGDTFFLELRRQGSDYDQGITREGGAAPAAITVYSYSEVTKKVIYQDRIPLAGAPGDMDYHSFKGFFGVRLNSVDQDFRGANLTVGGGDFWKHFSVDLQEPAMNVQPFRSTEWTPARVAACFLWEPADYTYRVHFRRTTVALVATSLGYERPAYRWFVEDQELDPTGTTIDLPLQVRRADGGQLLPPEPQTISFSYRVLQNRLELSSSEGYAGIHVSVKV